MIAPPPSEDVNEEPIALMAVTIALTESKSAKLNGSVRKVETGMVQDLAKIMTESLSASQSAVSI